MFEKYIQKEDVFLQDTLRCIYKHCFHIDAHAKSFAAITLSIICFLPQTEDKKGSHL